MTRIDRLTPDQTKRLYAKLELDEEEDYREALLEAYYDQHVDGENVLGLPPLDDAEIEEAILVMADEAEEDE